MVLDVFRFRFDQAGRSPGKSPYCDPRISRLRRRTNRAEGISKECFSRQEILAQYLTQGIARAEVLIGKEADQDEHVVDIGRRKRDDGQNDQVNKRIRLHWENAPLAV